MKNCKFLKFAVISIIVAVNLFVALEIRADSFTNSTPIFQFAVFYNGLLEFSDCAPLTINGPVHGNTDIYVGCLSSSSLTFNSFVTASGVITNPAWVGYQRSSWTGPIKYNTTPAPGWATGTPVLFLPISTNNSPASLREIINPPQPGESVTNPISSSRYFNKAFMVLTVSTNSIQLILKNTTYDAAALVYTYTISEPTNTAAWTNWNRLGITNSSTGWLSTNITNFYDARENRYARLTQIDVGKLGAWMASNSACISKWSSAPGFNGILYVQDIRPTNGIYMDAIRLINGAAITNGPYSASLPQGLYQSGLTVATPNPLYVLGSYNCPNFAFLLNTNTTLSRPCSFVCDAMTILSSAWDDSKSAGGFSGRNGANDTTINAAIITGNVPSTDSTANGYNGGVHNLPRLLEDWTGNTLWLNTSMVCLYNSVQATQQFQQPGSYYYAPTRRFLFDQNFNSLAKLPPGTPLLNKATAPITFSNLSQPYDGTAKNISVITTPPGLSVNVSYSGSASAPTNQDSYLAVAVINDPVYQGIATNTLTITAPAPTPSRSAA